MTNKATHDQSLVRSRSKTHDALVKAIESLVAGNEKLSIASFARTAGVTAGLIHNTYPAVAKKIRNLMGKSVRAQRDSKHQTLISERKKTGRSVQKMTNS